MCALPAHTAAVGAALGSASALLLVDKDEHVSPAGLSMPVPAVSAVILGQVHHTGNPRSFVSKALREDVTGSILNRRRVNVSEELRKHPAIPLLTYQRREEEPPPFPPSLFGCCYCSFRSRYSGSSAHSILCHTSPCTAPTSPLWGLPVFHRQCPLSDRTKMLLLPAE